MGIECVKYVNLYAEFEYFAISRTYASGPFIRCKRLLLALLLVLAGTNSVDAQRFAVKNNLLYDAAVMPNLGLEIKIDTTKTFELSAVYNPIEYPNNRKWKVMAFQPEFRFWTYTSFSGFYWGVNAIWGKYNVSRMPFSLFCDGNKRYQGVFYGGGLSCGYHWILSPHWGLEAGISIDYLHFRYDRFRCGSCGYNEEHANTNYLGPTRIDFSFVYLIK